MNACCGVTTFRRARADLVQGYRVKARFGEPMDSRYKQDLDSPPEPPVRPADEDCCRGGCERCVFDLYEDALERFEADLRAWTERQDGCRPQGADVPKLPAFR